jgi:hypothetical protein
MCDVKFLYKQEINLEYYLYSLYKMRIFVKIEIMKYVIRYVELYRNGLLTKKILNDYNR